MRCPECNAGLPKGAVLCVHCGYHLDKGKPLKTVHGRPEESSSAWDSDLAGRSPWGRFGVGILFQVILLAMPLLSPYLKPAPGGSRDRLAIPWIVIGSPVIWGIVGTYTRIRITRDRQGRTVLIRSYRILYVPLGKRSYPQGSYKAVWSDYRGRQRWGRRAERFWLYLGGDYREEMPLVQVYSGGNDDKMRQLCDVLNKVAGLTVRRL